MDITGTIARKAKSEAKSVSLPRGLQIDSMLLRGLQGDFSLSQEDQRTGTDLQTA